MKMNRREFFTNTGSVMGGLAAIFAGVKARAQGAADGFTIDDASHLNAAPVANVVISADHAALRSALVAARQGGKGIAMGGTRHSMGGQSIPARDGIALELPSQPLKIDAAGRSYTVGAGTTWHTIIEQLDKHGLSPAVMQSNDDFTIGGSLSVNAHGWPAPFGPIASTVQSFRLMKADGAVVNCSRKENAELFGMALGGYGMFGVILDATLDAVPNAVLRLRQKVMPATSFAAYFTDAIKNNEDVRMAYGRMSVSRDHFLTETIASTGHEIAAPGGVMPPLRSEALRNMALRQVYMMQRDSDWGKNLRWRAEKKVAQSARLEFSRNNILYTPLKTFQNTAAGRTDILHEYFVPPEMFDDFVTACRTIIPQHAQQLMNVTIRYVAADNDTALRYAADERLCLVMLFLQHKTPAAESDMAAMTKKMIDAALACGGSFYLPYRLHADDAQFAKAYPSAKKVFAARHAHDPHGVFGNGLTRRYDPVRPR